jgi:hypothetical protein
VLISSSGAAGGMFFFYHLGEYIFNWWARHFGSSKKKKVMTRGRRMIIRVKQRWGIRGLMLISAIISVPVSALLAARFYRHQRNTLPLMILGLFFWSLFLTSLAYLTDRVFQ